MTLEQPRHHRVAVIGDDHSSPIRATAANPLSLSDTDEEAGRVLSVPAAKTAKRPPPCSCVDDNNNCSDDGSPNGTTPHRKGSANTSGAPAAASVAAASWENEPQETPLTPACSSGFDDFTSHEASFYASMCISTGAAPPVATAGMKSLFASPTVRTGDSVDGGSHSFPSRESNRHHPDRAEGDETGTTVTAEGGNGSSLHPSSSAATTMTTAEMAGSGSSGSHSQHRRLSTSQRHRRGHPHATGPTSPMVAAAAEVTTLNGLLAWRETQRASRPPPHQSPPPTTTPTTTTITAAAAEWEGVAVEAAAELASSAPALLQSSATDAVNSHNNSTAAGEASVAAAAADGDVSAKAVGSSISLSTPSLPAIDPVISSSTATSEATTPAAGKRHGSSADVSSCGAFPTTPVARRSSRNSGNGYHSRHSSHCTGRRGSGSGSAAAGRSLHHSSPWSQSRTSARGSGATSAASTSTTATSTGVHRLPMAGRGDVAASGDGSKGRRGSLHTATGAEMTAGQLADWQDDLQARFFAILAIVLCVLFAIYAAMY